MFYQLFSFTKMNVGGVNTLFKKMLTVLMVSLALLSILAACGGTTSSASTSSTSTALGNVVHLGNDTFTQPSVTIQKGQSITLVNDSGAPHIIANGTWKNGSADTEKEAGAPTVNNVQVSGNATQSVGPFNTAGTFQLYCTIHPGMNLTVVVQ
jgi:plastocyanin